MIQVSGFKNKTSFIRFMVMVIAFFQISVMVGVNANPPPLKNNVVPRVVPPKQVQAPLKKCKGPETDGRSCEGEYTLPGEGVTIKMVGECSGTQCLCGHGDYGPY